MSFFQRKRHLNVAHDFQEITTIDPYRYSGTCSTVRFLNRKSDRIHA